MFPLSVEWFGLPDALKMHSTQLEYRLKGMTNDQLRQWWLSTGGPVLRADRDQGAGAQGGRATRKDAVGARLSRFPASSTPRRSAGTSTADLVGRRAGPLARPRAAQRRDGRRCSRRSSTSSARPTATGHDPTLVGRPHRGAGSRDAGQPRRPRRSSTASRSRTAWPTVKLTFTAMGCPASEFILEDMREPAAPRARRSRGAGQRRLGSALDRSRG